MTLFNKTPEQLVAEAVVKLKEEGVPDEINAALALIQLERYRNQISYQDIARKLIEIEPLPKEPMCYADRLQLQMMTEFNEKYGERANKYWCEFGIAQWGSAIRDHGFEMLNQLEEKRAKQRKKKLTLLMTGIIIALVLFGVLKIII